MTILQRQARLDQCWCHADEEFDDIRSVTQLVIDTDCDGDPVILVLSPEELATMKRAMAFCCELLSVRRASATELPTS